jgi:hypothetical protein
MTLPASGVITLDGIDTEFGLGRNLNAYRGQTWFRDDTTTGTFPGGAIGMNEFYSKRGDDPMPVLQFIGNYDLGATIRDAGATVTTTISLGAEDPDRRILIAHVSDYFVNYTLPSPLPLAQSCTIGGVSTTRYGNLAEGFPLTNEFAGYTGRWNIYVSPVIATGTSATLSCTCNWRTPWRTLSVWRVTKITNPVPVFQSSGTTSSITVSSMPAGSVCIPISQSGATAYTNATIRAAYSGNQGTYGQGDYQNLNRAAETRTISVNSGRFVLYRLR